MEDFNLCRKWINRDNAAKLSCQVGPISRISGKLTEQDTRIINLWHDLIKSAKHRSVFHALSDHQYDVTSFSANLRTNKRKFRFMKCGNYAFEFTCKKNKQKYQNHVHKRAYFTFAIS